MKKKLKKPIFFIPLIAVLTIALVSIYFVSNSKKTLGNTLKIERTNLSQEISISGKTKPAESVNMAFEKSGRISRIYVDVGKQVKTGQILAALENSELAAQVAEAEANTKVEEAKLRELRQGTRPEEIQVQETKTASLKISLGTSKKNLIDKIQDAYTKSDDAVRNRVDQFFKDPTSANPQLTFLVSVPQTENSIKSGRITVESSLNAWKNNLGNLATESDLGFYLNESFDKLNKLKNFLDVVSSAVNEAELKTDGSALLQSTVDTWKADVSTGRTNVNSAISNLTAADEKLNQTEADLKLAESELALKKAGAVEEQIIAQEAMVQKSKANADYYRSQLSKTIVRSPIDGVVTKKDAEAGEIIAANTSVVSVISEHKFEIETNIPEADVSKILAGAETQITLDAYGDEVVFKAKVIAVDPAETITDGVATYKTKLQFLNEDERIKSGMTANLNIATANFQNVIAVPQSALILKNGKKYVRLLKNGKVREVEIKTGAKGADSRIEVTEGLSEGDIILTDAKK